MQLFGHQTTINVINLHLVNHGTETHQSGGQRGIDLDHLSANMLYPLPYRDKGKQEGKYGIATNGILLELIIHTRSGVGNAFRCRIQS